MEKELEEFNKEIELLKRIINGFLSTNPILAKMELSMLAIKPKQSSPKNEHFSKEVDAKFEVRATIDFASCKPCKDALGNDYCYYGAGSCPILP